MTAILTWFDPRGRLSRRAFGRVFVGLLGLSAILLCIVIWISAQGQRPAALAFVGLIGVIWVASLAQAIRRLHDRDRTGWWLAIYVVLSFASILPIENAVDTYPILVTSYALASLAFSLWFLFETLGRRGTAEANRYGDAPPV